MKVQTKVMIKKTISWIFNRLVFTHKRRLFVSYLENSPHDRYDILNCGSSNMFSVLNYMAKQYHEEPIDVFLEYYDEDRLQDYSDFIEKAKANNMSFKFIKAPNGLCSLLKFNYYRFSSAIWINESGGTTFYGRKPNQRIICFNYFISCKEDYQVGLERKWDFLDYLTTTALLPSQIISASNGVLLGNCHITGFPRNDTLFNHEKETAILEWIQENVGFKPEKIIVYAPTYRDYEKKNKKVRPLLGYDVQDLGEYLRKHKAVIICKLHPYQNVEAIQGTDAIIQYESTYDYSLYDVLAISDCLICDYSSLIFDYLLIDKPIIYNLYDLGEYEKVRGLSYYPYSMICAGDIVTNKAEFMTAIDSVISGNDKYKNSREKVRQIIHKYPSDGATQRTYDDLKEYLNRTIGMKL